MLFSGGALKAAGFKDQKVLQELNIIWVRW
jgi:hypothetical protein